MKMRIRQHLEAHRKITTMEAFEMYGCTRLSEYIRELRCDGMNIITTPMTSINRYHQKVRYGIYELRD